MIWLALGLALFLGTHSIGAVAPGLRAALVDRLGPGPWKGLYSLGSAAGLALILWGFPAARATSAVALWTPPVALRPVAWALLLPAFVLLAAAYLPGRIRALAGGHPMLAGTALWAFAHLLVNGLLHEVLLFGGFLLWAVVVRWSFRTRIQGPLPTAPPSPYNDALAVAIGVGLYALTVAGLHRWVLGVAPIPGLDWF